MLLYFIKFIKYFQRHNFTFLIFKVGAFTQNSAKETLQKTLQSINLPNNPERTLFEEQKDLANIEEAKRNQARNLEAKKNVLEGLILQLNNMKIEVDRMESRKKALESLELYGIALVIQEVKEGKKVIDDKQKIADDAAVELSKAKVSVEPLEKIERELKIKKAVYSRNEDDVLNKVEKNELKIRRMKEKVEDDENKIVEARNEMNLIDDMRKRDETKLQQYQRDLKKHNDILVAVTQKLPEINRLMSESKSRIIELLELEINLNEEISDLTNELQRFDTIINVNSKKVGELKDSKQLFRQKLSYILANGENNGNSRNIRDAMNLMDHLDRNMEGLIASGVLRSEIYGPVAMYLKVSSAVCAVIIEKSVPPKRWFSFIASNDQDSDYIKKYMREKGLYLDVFTMKNTEILAPILPRTMLENNFKNIGMVGHISRELLDCPNIIRSFLYIWHGLHNVMWAQSDENSESISDRHFNLLCPGDISGFRLYVHNTSKRNENGFNIMQYNGTKSKYNNKMSTSGNSASVPSSFTTVLQYGGETLGDKKKELEDAILDAKEKKNPLLAIYSEKKNHANRIRDELQELKGRRNEYQKVLNLPKATENNITTEMKKIREIESKLSKNMINEKKEKSNVYEGCIKAVFKNIAATISLCEVHTELEVESTVTTVLKGYIDIELRDILEQIIDGKEGLKVFEKAVKTAQNDRYVRASSKADDCLLGPSVYRY